MKWLLYGHRGWIGGQVIDHIKRLYPDDEIQISNTRVDDAVLIEQDLKTLAPDRVLCLIGRTHGDGIQTIDYLEQKGKLIENVHDNLYAPLLLATLCHKLQIHLTYMGTGCIFNYDSEHLMDSDIGFTESANPNYFDSSYSVVKGFTDRLMHLFDTSTLNVRIRMPITNVDCPRNFISKIIRYQKICSMPNSMTVLDELIPIMLDMAVKSETGTINLTNPGAIQHNRILDLYQQIVDPTFTYQNFTLDQQNQVLASGRSNNLLSTDLLIQKYPQVNNIEDAIVKTLSNWTK